MDASAPPVELTDEKSRMNQPPPPPYHEYPGPGYPQPGLGYPYPQPNPGYPQPNPGYPQPGPGYHQPNPGYTQPGLGYPPQPQGNVGLPPYGNAAYGQQTHPIGQQYPAQPAIMSQPVVYAAPVVLVYPAQDHLGWSIFTMLFCCLPLGIAALIYSISTREANRMGDQMKAEQCSKTARTLNRVGLGVGLGILILTIAMMAWIMIY